MSQSLTESEMFALLAKRQRRLLLRILQESSVPLRTVQLAQRIGEHEHGDPSIEDRRAIYLSLYHNHLPRLEEASAIVHSRDEGTVAPDRNFDDLVRVLGKTDERDLAWSNEGDLTWPGE